jgi:hypothetical protein
MGHPHLERIPLRDVDEVGIPFDKLRAGFRLRFCPGKAGAKSSLRMTIPQDDNHSERQSND